MALVAPLVLHASTLININTADLAALETLTGIGPTKAQAIIDYRTETGPFAAIEDIQNVSGIGPATYAEIKDSITVSGASDSGGSQDSGGQQAGDSGGSDGDGSDGSDPQASAVSAGAPLPPTVSARITTDATALAGAGTTFVGSAFDAGGTPVSGARYLWNFGDGTTAEGQHVLHTYHYPGEYGVMLSVGYDYSSATARLTIAAIAPRVGLVAEGDGSLTVANSSNTDIDIGGWALGQGSSTPFRVPDGTVALAGHGVRFAAAILGFAGDATAELTYPNGTFAASATVGAASPLRGEAVELMDGGSSVSSAQNLSKKSSDLPSGAEPPAGQTFSQDSAPSAPTTTINGDDQAASAALGYPWDIPWSYLLALAAIVALGAAGAYYAQILAPAAASATEETDELADEFDIE